MTFWAEIALLRVTMDFTNFIFKFNVSHRQDKIFLIPVIRVNLAHTNTLDAFLKKRLHRYVYYAVLFLRDFP
jgi:hypothetical protein